MKPTLNHAGKVVYEANPEQKTLHSFDDHRDLPVGFGVKVSLTKKNYVIQRRVASSDRNVSEGKKPSSVLKVKVGNVSGFPGIDEAREDARQLVPTMIATKRNPNKIRRERYLPKLTVSEAFAQYRRHLRGRIKSVKPNVNTPHTYRHSFIMHMLSHRQPKKVLQATVGHKDPRSIEVYTRVFALEHAATRRCRLPGTDGMRLWYCGHCHR